MTSLADEIRRTAAAQHRQADEQDALGILPKSLRSTSSSSGDQEGVRYFLAAGLLARAGSDTQARAALETAVAKNPSLKKEPSAFLLAGIIVNREGRPEEALRYFAQAKSLASPEDTHIKATSDLLSGAVAYKSDRKTAEGWFSERDVQEQVETNPGWGTFLAREFREPRLTDALILAKPQ